MNCTQLFRNWAGLYYTRENKRYRRQIYKRTKPNMSPLWTPIAYPVSTRTRYPASGPRRTAWHPEPPSHHLKAGHVCAGPELTGRGDMLGCGRGMALGECPEPQADKGESSRRNHRRRGGNGKDRPSGSAPSRPQDSPARATGAERGGKG